MISPAPPPVVIEVAVGVAAWSENGHPPSGISLSGIAGAEGWLRLGRTRWYGGLVARYQAGTIYNKSRADVGLSRPYATLNVAHLFGDEVMHGPRFGAGVHAAYFDGLEDRRYTGPFFEFAYWVLQRDGGLCGSLGAQLGLGSRNDSSTPNGGLFLTIGYAFSIASN